MVIRCFGDDLAGFVHDDFDGPPDGQPTAGGITSSRHHHVERGSVTHDGTGGRHRTPGAGIRPSRQGERQPSGNIVFEPHALIFSAKCP
jgi:hypothetical protein